MDSKLHMIICEEFASSTKMFESQPRARKDWLQQHQKIKLKSCQAGLDYKDDDATWHWTNALKLLLQKLYGKTERPINEQNAEFCKAR